MAQVAGWVSVLVLAQALGVARAQENSLSDEEARAGWKLLFDGKSTDGWRGYKKDAMPPGWKAVDGILARVAGGSGGKGAGGGDDIVTVEEFESFELSLEWKIVPGGNAGILYHVIEQAPTSWHEAPEMQVLDNAKWPKRDHRQLAGACYDLYAPSKDATRPAGEWNKAKLVVDGAKVEHWLNGEKIVEYEVGSEDWNRRVAASKFKDKPLFAKAAKGRICIQDHSDRGEYRNIKVRRLGARAQDAEKPFVENADGLVVVEAEHPHAKADKDPHKWTLVKQPAGFSGEGAMEAKPNDETNNNEDFAALSPRMDYKVKFAKAGKYRVWVRGYGATDSDNSCHVGLDGKAVDAADRIGEFPTEEWAWLNDTHDSEPAILDIKEAGLHTVNVWMREDGFVLDKIVLTQKEDYRPADKGPAETR